MEERARKKDATEPSESFDNAAHEDAKDDGGDDEDEDEDEEAKD